MVNHGQCFKNSVNQEIQSFSLCPKMTQCKVLTWSMGITFSLFICLIENENKESAQEFKNTPSGNLLYNLSYLLCQPFWVHSHPQYMKQKSIHALQVTSWIFCTAFWINMKSLHAARWTSTSGSISKICSLVNGGTCDDQALLTKPCWFTLQRSDQGV